MKICILHNPVEASDSPDTRDVLQQAQAVGEALEKLEHRVVVADCSLDLQKMLQYLREERVEMVFNLVESLAGSGRLLHLPPALLENAALPFSGCSAEALTITSNKTLAKKLLRLAGLPTPDWIDPLDHDAPGWSAWQPRQGWIIKSRWEHASLGMDSGSVVHPASPDQLLELLAGREQGPAGPCFAERFIDGREFNLSLLAGAHDPEVLPPAEIVFEGYGPAMPHIVDYQAKWDPSSFAAIHTRRFFPDAANDQALLTELGELARSCWRLFALNGYARIDFRVDERGRPWILEINANPCLSPDAGFAAAAARAGLPFHEAIRRILADPAGTPLLRSPTPRSEPESCRPLGLDGLIVRFLPEPDDVERITDLTARTGFFSKEEIAVAAELVQERLNRGATSGYHFIMAEKDSKLAGYSCFGPVPCTRSSYDLYWIVVDPDKQRQGLGRLVLEKTEGQISDAGGGKLFAETSGRLQYAGSRRFYENNGFIREHLFRDFYAPGDDKVVYSKEIRG